METIVCKCKNTFDIDYSFGYVLGDFHWWQCKVCGQDYKRKIRPVIILEENGDTK